MTARLQGRIALVTGSTDGIGAGIARALADEGAFVVISGRNAAKGEKVVAEIAERGGAAAFVGADLAGGIAAARELADAAQAAAGAPLDILVNNAAMLIGPGPTAEISEELIDGALAVNVKSVILLTGLIAPGMAARGSGAIVNVGSINGLIGMAGSALYSATKTAIHSLTKSWAAEYGPSGRAGEHGGAGPDDDRAERGLRRPHRPAHRPGAIPPDEHSGGGRQGRGVPRQRRRVQHPRLNPVRRRRLQRRLVAVGVDEGGDAVVQLAGPVEVTVAAGDDGDLRVRHPGRAVAGLGRGDEGAAGAGDQQDRHTDGA